MVPIDLVMPQPGALRRYLKAHGWEQASTRLPYLSLFSLNYDDDGSLEIVVPQTHDAPQADRRIQAALETLSEIEGRSAGEVAAAVMAIGRDAVRERVEDRRNSSIPLSTAEIIIVRNRKLLHAAAIAEFSQRKADNIPVAANNFVEKCQFGHTFRGSFGFSIYSPIAPKPYAGLVNDQPPLPTERLVIQRVMRGLSSLADDRATAHEKALVDPAIGFSADMFDSLAGILEGSRSQEVGFEFELSPEWLADEDLPQRARYIVDASLSGFAKDMASLLRKKDELGHSVVSGFVTKLATKENPADLENQRGSFEVTIEWHAGAKPLPVRVLLAPSDYLVALKAHADHRVISVEGHMEHAGRGYIIRGATLLSGD